jgi:hypothetical protein
MTEQFYDDVIAPQLAALAKLCAEQGASFVACVGFDGTLAETTLLAEDPSPAVDLVYRSIKAVGNIDALIMGAIKRKQVRNSIFLARYLEPEPDAQSPRQA